MNKKIIYVLTIVGIAMMAGCASPSTQQGETENSTISTNPTEAIQSTEVIESTETIQSTDVTPKISTPNPENNSAPLRNETSTTYIGEETAKEIALAHAGLAETDVTFIKAKLDHDDGRTVYDIEFYVGTTEYDYEIDAITGNITEYDVDYD